ncbi:tetratricopeptide (TPR) repeat protein [Allocatelliglobosispora scoriae]|uniref:Tetratricopeptide (TPR) repeat protein n=1 Tax=Allocatelliglobosispora scoriae TaxID=643052 RepID=A0A841BQ10_9ACTN|nr:FxSxx-COOH system tetratricopeptide repeat protein [Allocatelliglobosispora scoriae]MBB5868842.1 tetratricopeptide (TPR) repeat protein [Allocatelliglobosispora scoriae]
MTETSTGTASATGSFILRYAATDRAWAEWIEELLVSAGARIIDDAPGAADPHGLPADLRTLLIVSSAEPMAATGGGRNTLAVYVADVRPLASVPAERSAVLHGLDEASAAERVLRLTGHGGASRPLPADPRFPGTEPMVFNAPARNPRFTGRDAALRDLRARLRTQPTGAVALHGTDGSGKTQIAVEYAHRFRTAYDVVWWIAAEPPQFVDTSLLELASRLGMKLDPSSEANTGLLLAALRRGEPTSRWLIVFDNADDFERISPLVPTGGGHVILTSGNPAWHDRAHPMPVDAFQRAESITHLRRRMPLLTDAEAASLAGTLGDLPLAVSVAGAFLAETSTPVADYLRRLGQGTPAELTVRAWEMSLDWLAGRSRAAFKLLQLCSMLAPEIPFEMLYGDEMADALVPFDSSASERLMRTILVQNLNRLALIKIDDKAAQIYVHRRLQRVVERRMSTEEQRQTRHEIHLVLAGARPDGEVDDPPTWPRFRSMWPHLLISDATGCRDERTRQLFIDRVRYLWLRGDLLAGKRFGERISQEWSALLDDPAFAGDRTALRRQLLNLRFNLANILRSTDGFQASSDLDNEVLAAQRELLGDRHPHTVITMGSVGADLRGLGSYPQALELAATTHDAAMAVFGENHPRTLAAANNLAVSFRLMGDFHSATHRDEDVLARRREVLGPDHPATFHSASCLGRDYRDAGDYAKSVAMLRQVYDGIVAARGAEGTEAVIAQVNLAASLRADGRPEEAMPLLDDAYERLRGRLGERQTETLACRLGRTSNLLAMGRNELAGAELRALIEDYRAALGPAHPHTLICMSNLSAVTRALGDRVEARSLAQHAADELAQHLPASHPFLLGAQTNLSVCLAEDGDLAAARAVAERTLALLAESLGSEHPDALRCEANLALILRGLGESGPGTDHAAIVERLAASVGADHHSVQALRTGVYSHRVIDPHPF